MKYITVVGIALGALVFSALAVGQGAPLGAARMLAMDSSASHTGDVEKHIDVTDSGGGSGLTTTLGNADSEASTTTSIATPRPLGESRHGDPGLPAAATPKRPTYRWQSLVPGAIK